jgi:hypothetical protein
MRFSQLLMSELSFTQLLMSELRFTQLLMSELSFSQLLMSKLSFTQLLMSKLSFTQLLMSKLSFTQLLMSEPRSAQEASCPRTALLCRQSDELHSARSASPGVVECAGLPRSASMLRLPGLPRLKPELTALGCPSRPSDELHPACSASPSLMNRPQFC